MHTIKKLEKLENPVKEYHKAGYYSHAPQWKWNRKATGCTIYYIISGSVKVSLYNEEFVCKENDVFYLSQDEEAVLENMSDSEKLSLYYVIFEFVEGKSFKSLGVERVVADNEQKFFHLIRTLYKTRLAEGVAYKIKEYSEFLKLFYELITVGVNTDESLKVDIKLGKSVQYMKMNFYKSVTVEKLAEISGYSVSHFRRLFVSTYGVSPQEYLLNYRISKAKELLIDEEDKSIDEIADFLGMCNSSYFCKMFKKKTGMSPHKYKKENIED